MKKYLGVFKIQYVILGFVFLSYLPFQNCSQWKGNISVSDKVESLSSESPQLIDDLVKSPIGASECKNKDNGEPQIKNVACENDPARYNEFTCKKGIFVDSNGKDDCRLADLPPQITDVKLTSKSCGKVSLEILAQDDLTTTDKLQFFKDGIAISNPQEFSLSGGTFAIAANTISVKDQKGGEAVYASDLSQIIESCPPPPPPPPFVNSKPIIKSAVLSALIDEKSQNTCEKLKLKIEATDADNDKLTYFLRSSESPYVEIQIDNEFTFDVTTGTLALAENTIVVKDVNGGEALYDKALSSGIELCDRTPPSLEQILITPLEKSCAAVRIEIEAHDMSGIESYEITFGTIHLKQEENIFIVRLPEEMREFGLDKEAVRVTDKKGNSILSGLPTANTPVVACFAWSQKSGEDAWGSCSAECGGTQSAQFECHDFNGARLTESGKCGKKPEISQRCASKLEKVEACGPNFKGEIKYSSCNIDTGVYASIDKSSCHANCSGVGEDHHNLDHGASETSQTTVSEKLNCSFDEQGFTVKYNASLTKTCNDGKITESIVKDDRAPASTDTCPSYAWSVKKNNDGQTAWSSCSADCGGTQSASYVCLDDKGQLADETRCLGTSAKPTLSQVCDGNPEFNVKGEAFNEYVFIASTAKCTKYHNEPGFIYKTKSTQAVTTCNTQTHQKQTEDKITFGEENCVTVQSQRCGDDSLSPMQALGRLEWMKKCQNEFPSIKSFFDATRSVAGSPLKVLDRGVRDYLKQLQLLKVEDPMESLVWSLSKKHSLSYATSGAGVLNTKLCDDLSEGEKFATNLEFGTKDDDAQKIAKVRSQFKGQFQKMICFLDAHKKDPRDNMESERTRLASESLAKILNFRSLASEPTLGEAIQGLEDAIALEDKSAPGSGLMMRLDHSNPNIHFIDKHIRTLTTTPEGINLVKSVEAQFKGVYNNFKHAQKIKKFAESFLGKLDLQNQKITNGTFQLEVKALMGELKKMKNILGDDEKEPLSHLDAFFDAKIIYWGNSEGPLDYALFKYLNSKNEVITWTAAPKPVLPSWLQTEIMKSKDSAAQTLRSTRIAPDVSTIPCSPPAGVKATQIYIPAVCRSSCTTPEAQLLVQIKEQKSKSFMDAFVEQTSSVVTLSEEAGLNDLKFQETPVRRYIRDYDDVAQPLRVFTMASGKIVKFTPNHPILGQDGTMRLAATFKAGESLVKKDSTLDSIVSVEDVSYFGKVYNVYPLSSEVKANIVVTDGYLNGTAFYQDIGSENIDRIILRTNLLGDSL